jgi:hypothetical protein
MTSLSEFEAFQTKVQSLPEVGRLLDEMTHEATLHELTDVQRAEPLTTALSLVAVAALWKLINLGIDSLRSMAEDETLRCRIEMIGQLRDLGYERQAPFILERLQKELRERPDNDPVLKALSELLA